MLSYLGFLTAFPQVPKPIAATQARVPEEAPMAATPDAMEGFVCPMCMSCFQSREELLRCVQRHQLPCS